MNRFVAILLVVFVGGVIWRFPLFHVVPLKQANGATQQTAFDAATVATTFWRERLVPALEQAANAATVLTALRENPQAAAEESGRAAGLGRARFYLLRGAGMIVSVEKNGVGVSLSDAANEPVIVLKTGLLFGNTVRDVTGLIDASSFSNSQQFNNISAELNRIVENKVIQPLKQQAEVGRRIQFVGCAQVIADSSELTPLKLIPLDVDFE